MSHTRLCADCGLALHAEEVTQLHEHGGPHFDHWRARLAATVGAVIPERMDTNPEQR